MSEMLGQGGGVRLTLSALFALVMAEYRYYEPALLLLVFCIVLDYVTGMTRAWMKGELSSRTGLRGFVKKLCYVFGVAAGFAADLLISLMVEGLGVSIDIPAVLGLTVTLMLSLNELISVIENLGEIGVPMPSQLTHALHKLEGQNKTQEG